MLAFDIIWYPPEKFNDSNLPLAHQMTMAQFAMYVGSENILKHTHENKDGLDYYIDIPMYLVAKWLLDLSTNFFSGNLRDISNQYILPSCQFEKIENKISVNWGNIENNGVYFISSGEILIDYIDTDLYVIKTINKVMKVLIQKENGISKKIYQEIITNDE